ncbi:helix-turn-helix domain-containing protein [Gammaproteobacteria bacterium]|nr:helix-turn-helix domain-containing protein [Gammaproteobacteria bacterium]
MDINRSIGQKLREARKQRFPTDDLKAFALRIGVGRATLQRMEKGDMSVAIGRYYCAAQVLGLSDTFSHLFEQPESLFDD